MYVLVIIIKETGKERRLVCGRKGPLNNVLKTLEHTDKDWRLHDGSGWCDSSEDAWKHIHTIHGTMAEIIEY